MNCCSLLDTFACLQAKQHELHCCIGEALVCAALGSKSPAGRDLWTVTEDEFVVSCFSDTRPRRFCLVSCLILTADVGQAEQ